jgi:sugar phosphate isomerase/epimerase
MSTNNHPTNRRDFISKMGIGILGAPYIIKNLNAPYQVKIGTITYSFRDMPHQDGDSILQYVLETGVKNIELMGDPAEAFAGRPQSKINMRSVYPLLKKRWDKLELTEDEKKQLADFEKERKANDEATAIWRKTASMKKFEEFRKIYNKAGVSIYAFKPDCFNVQNTDADIHFGMNAAKALGASHVTLEFNPNEAHTLKLATIASGYGIKVGYHGHEQQTPTLWDKALAQSPANGINLDLGHFVAAGNKAPLDFVKEKHDQILSMHIKDRLTPEHGKGNVVWGKGDTPIADALKLMRDQKYSFPATIELEYEVPKDSDPVKEVKKCVEYCKNVLG